MPTTEACSFLTCLRSSAPSEALFPFLERASALQTWLGSFQSLLLPESRYNRPSRWTLFSFGFIRKVFENHSTIIREAVQYNLSFWFLLCSPCSVITHHNFRTKNKIFILFKLPVYATLFYCRFIASVSWPALSFSLSLSHCWSPDYGKYPFGSPHFRSVFPIFHFYNPPPLHFGIRSIFVHPQCPAGELY